jgi:hypothetical protein
MMTNEKCNHASPLPFFLFSPVFFISNMATLLNNRLPILKCMQRRYVQDSALLIEAALDEWRSLFPDQRPEEFEPMSLVNRLILKEYRECNGDAHLSLPPPNALFLDSPRMEKTPKNMVVVTELSIKAFLDACDIYDVESTRSIVSVQTVARLWSFLATIFVNFIVSSTPDMDVDQDADADYLVDVLDDRIQLHLSREHALDMVRNLYTNNSTTQPDDYTVLDLMPLLGQDRDNDDRIGGEEQEEDRDNDTSSSSLFSSSSSSSLSSS